MKKSYSFLFTGIIFFAAIFTTWWITKQHYDQHKINDSVFASLDSSVQVANFLLLHGNKKGYDLMLSRAKSDLSMKEQVLLWKPKLDSAVRMGINIHQFFREVNQDMFMHPHNEELNEKHFKRILDSLVHLRENLVNILPENRRHLLQPLALDAGIANITHNHFYEKLSDSGRMSIFSTLEFSALQSVNAIVDIVNQQSCHLDIEYDQFDVLIGQNSTYLLPGQTLEVSAGLGAYSMAAKPTIAMNGQRIQVNENGVAIYKKLVSMKDSSGKINVSVSFKDPNTGFIKAKTMVIAYTVFHPAKN